MTATWSSVAPAGIDFSDATQKSHGATVRKDSADGRITTWYARIEHTVYVKVEVYLRVTSNYKETPMTIRGLRHAETGTEEGTISFQYGDTSWHLNRTRYLTITDVTHDDTITINLRSASGTPGSGLAGAKVVYENVVPKSAMRVWSDGEIVDGIVYAHDGSDWCESSGVMAHDGVEWCESI